MSLGKAPCGHDSLEESGGLGAGCPWSWWPWNRHVTWSASHRPGKGTPWGSPFLAPLSAFLPVTAARTSPSQRSVRLCLSPPVCPAPLPRGRRLSRSLSPSVSLLLSLQDHSSRPLFLSFGPCPRPSCVGLTEDLGTGSQRPRGRACSRGGTVIVRGLSPVPSGLLPTLVEWMSSACWSPVSQKLC